MSLNNCLYRVSMRYVLFTAVAWHASDLLLSLLICIVIIYLVCIAVFFFFTFTLPQSITLFPTLLPYRFAALHCSVIRLCHPVLGYYLSITSAVLVYLPISICEMSVSGYTFHVSMCSSLKTDQSTPKNFHPLRDLLGNTSVHSRSFPTASPPMRSSSP